jgi:hypothetical protein
MRFFPAAVLAMLVVGCGGSGDDNQQPNAQYVGTWEGTFRYRKSGSTQEEGTLRLTISASGNTVADFYDTVHDDDGEGTGGFTSSQDIVIRFAFTGGSERRAAGRIALDEDGRLVPYSREVYLPTTINNFPDGELDFHLTKL